MISQEFEKLIIQGKAINRVLNVATAVSKYNTGRSRSVIVNALHVQPLIQTFTIDLPNGTPADAEQAVRDMFTDSAIFTLTAYDNEHEYNITFKNRLNVDVCAYQTQAARGFLVTATSILDFKEDIFWLFNGEQISFEISEIRNTLNGAATTSASTNYTSKRPNPSGFNDPIIDAINAAGNVIYPLQIGQIAPGAQPQYQELVIAKNGTGLTGNKMSDVPTANANITQPVININLIEFNAKHYDNI